MKSSPAVKPLNLLSHWYRGQTTKWIALSIKMLEKNILVTFKRGMTLKYGVKVIRNLRNSGKYWSLVKGREKGIFDTNGAVRNFKRKVMQGQVSTYSNMIFWIKIVTINSLGFLLFNMHLETFEESKFRNRSAYFPSWMPVSFIWCPVLLLSWISASSSNSCQSFVLMNAKHWKQKFKGQSSL